MGRAPHLRLALAVVTLAGLVTGLVLVLLPLPTTRTTELGVSTTVVCGTGTRSASALSVLLDPAMVARDSATVAGQEQAELTEQLCLGLAQTRLLEGMGIALPVGVACLVLWAVTEAPRRRSSAAFAEPRPAGWYPDPWSPGAWRWWDGARWGPPHHEPPGVAGGT